MGDLRDHRTLIGRACLLGLFGGAMFGACANTDQNLEKQRLLDELNAAGTNKPAQCKPGIVEACYGGPDGTSGRGMCRGGNRTCGDDATWGACTGEVLPKKESCNRSDDDCDGIIDNNFEREGARCTIGAGSCKSSGTWSCNADGAGATCNAPPPKSEPERCDGVDNDCDLAAGDAFAISHERKAQMAVGCIDGPVTMRERQQYDDSVSRRVLDLEDDPICHRIARGQRQGIQVQPAWLRVPPLRTAPKVLFGN